MGVVLELLTAIPLLQDSQVSASGEVVEIENWNNSTTRGPYIELKQDSDVVRL